MDLATSRECDCLAEMVVIASMLCGENIWFRPQTDRAAANRAMREQQWKEKKEFRQAQAQGKRSLQGPQHPQHAGRVRSEEEERAEAAHAALRHPLGDHFTYLHIFREWEASGFAHDWCQRNYINFRSLKAVRKIR